MQKLEMLKLRLDGKSYQAIALLAGVSRQRIQQLLCPPSSIRKSVVNRAGGQCEVCGIFVGNTGHVHHKNNDEDYNDLPNLQLLCPSCHRRQHTPPAKPKVVKARAPKLSDEERKIRARNREHNRTTGIVAVRVTNSVAEMVKSRCAKRGITVTEWLTRAIDSQLRKR